MEREKKINISRTEGGKKEHREELRKGSRKKGDGTKDAFR